MKVPINKIKYKYLNFLLCFYTIYNLFVCLIDCRYLSSTFNFHLLILTSALMSTMLILDDVIADVYGIKIAAQLYFSMVFIRMLISIPFYIFYKDTILAKYLIFITFYHPLAFTFAWYTNVSLLIKWKILMHGKYFWMRSVATSGIAVFIICLLSIPEDMKFSTWSFHQILFFDFMFSNIFINLFNAIFAFFGSIAVRILKIVEFSNNLRPLKPFNPFKQNHVA